MKCPVVVAIEEIRGGLWEDDQEESADRVVKIGGACGVSFVCDDVQYYMMSRKLELARFELSRPSLEACRRMYDVAMNRPVSVAAIIDRCGSHLYNQFIKLVDIIGAMEDVIITKIEAISRKGQSINLSLPDMILLPNIDQIIKYRPDILCITMNKLISYVNKINVAAILATPVAAYIKPVASFNELPPQLVIPTYQQFAAPDEYIAAIKLLIAEEMKMCEYVRGVEKYQCDVINHMNQVYDYCQKIIDNL